MSEKSVINKLTRGSANVIKNLPSLQNRSGQVTIFIILAIIIVAIGILIYSFYPQIKSSLTVEEQNPVSFIQSCIEEEISSAAKIVSEQGGSISPENYLLYNNSQVEYLCYTVKNDASNCIIQQPMLKQHIESEIKKNIEASVDACFNSLESNYIKQGYSVNLVDGDTKIELLPKRITATFNYSLTLTKGEDSQNYDSFIAMINNNLYELVSIANSIIDWEATYGNAETTTYMTLYHDLKVEKDVQGDRGKVYILTDRNTGNKFQFATRGQIWPAGYTKPTI